MQTLLCPRSRVLTGLQYIHTLLCLLYFPFAAAPPSRLTHVPLCVAAPCGDEVATSVLSGAGLRWRSRLRFSVVGAQPRGVGGRSRRAAGAAPPPPTPPPPLSPYPLILSPSGYPAPRLGAAGARRRRGCCPQTPPHPRCRYCRLLLQQLRPPPGCRRGRRGRHQWAPSTGAVHPRWAARPPRRCGGQGRPVDCPHPRRGCRGGCVSERRRGRGAACRGHGRQRQQWCRQERGGWSSAPGQACCLRGGAHASPRPGHYVARRGAAGCGCRCQ